MKYSVRKPSLDTTVVHFWTALFINIHSKKLPLVRDGESAMI